MPQRLIRRSRPVVYRAVMIVTVLASMLWVSFGASSQVFASVQDFSYDSWRVDVELTVDDEGRAVAHFTETMTARFPDVDQNRGIVRGIPKHYEGASTHPHHFSVTDEHGTPVPFEIEEDDTFIAVLTGDNNYVHGRQVYVISYTLNDVILTRDDGTADEFYWDLTDFEHAQAVSEFRSSILFSDTLTKHLTGNMRCYTGVAKSTQECTISRSADTSRIETAPVSLEAQEGVTVAIALDAGTVTQPEARKPNFFFDTLLPTLTILGTALGLTGTIVCAVMRKKRRTAPGPIIAQYDVPPYLPPLIASALAGNKNSPIPAQLVHLAVIGTIRFEETLGPDGVPQTRHTTPALRLLDPSRALDPLDTMALMQLFDAAAIGTVMTLPKTSASFVKRMNKMSREAQSATKNRGYFHKQHSPLGRALGIFALTCSLLSILFALIAIVHHSASSESADTLYLALSIIGLALSISAIKKHEVYTPLGAHTRQYLLGVREFIRVAEADRIQMLQSYEGAERRPDGTIQVIHLYERLLPYAIIFGLEKQWAEVLAVKYSEQPSHAPHWYPGVISRGVQNLTSEISSFTSSLNSSVSFTSSSSGGSRGGGYSGGGGGGGFSGGR